MKIENVLYIAKTANDERVKQLVDVFKKSEQVSEVLDLITEACFIYIYDVEKDGVPDEVGEKLYQQAELIRTALDGIKDKVQALDKAISEAV